MSRSAARGTRSQSTRTTAAGLATPSTVAARNQWLLSFPLLRLIAVSPFCPNSIKVSVEDTVGADKSGRLPKSPNKSGGARSTSTVRHRLHRTLRLSRRAAFRFARLGIQRAPSGSSEGRAPSKWCATRRTEARPAPAGKRTQSYWRGRSAIVDFCNSKIVAFDDFSCRFR